LEIGIGRQEYEQQLNKCMTDTPVEQPVTPIGPRTRVIAAAIGGMFAMGIVIYLVTKGSPTNSLHESALSWSYLMMMGILGGLGFGAIKDLIPLFKPKG
jgi:hypothetical protein